MKTIHPVTRYDDDQIYPASEVPTSRRRFLGQTIGGALAGLLLPVGTAEAGRRAPRAAQRIWFRLLRRHIFSGGRFQLGRLLVQTKSRRLTAFVRSSDERAGLDAAIRKVLATATSADLTNQKRLARLQARVAKSIAARYRRRRRRSVAAPIVTLDVRRRRRVPVPGGIRPPRHPHP